MKPFFTVLAALALAACAGAAPPAPAKAAPAAPGYQEAVFAGGCFWCAEHDLEKVPGVVDVVSGYAGGESLNPTYENHRGHLEVVRVRFDPAVVSYRQLVDAFWPLIDPTDPGGQFCDRGESYQSAVFATPEQRADAEASREAAQTRLKAKIVTPVRPAAPFWLAEDYHQDYAKNNPVRYRLYRTGCDRDARLREVWGR